MACARAPKTSLTALRRRFRRPGGTLSLVQGDIRDWEGDALATSTSQNLEGIQRKGWWGFHGRASADAALHDSIQGLRELCRAQRKGLDFGEVVATSAGPLKVKHLLHTAVPSHPGSKDPGAMPAEVGENFVWPAEIMEAEAAEALLYRAFREVGRRAIDLGVQSLCYPSMGCGCRGFPSQTVARIGLNVLASPIIAAIPYIEVRCTQQHVLKTWLEQSCWLGLEECE